MSAYELAQGLGFTAAILLVAAVLFAFLADTSSWNERRYSAISWTCFLIGLPMLIACVWIGVQV